ncbi:MAG: RlmE family RNA methyltransferase [bacterium]
MKKVRDHYFHKARREGHASRSIYKLEEIDRRHRLLRRGQRVLDLGAAPGSWLAYAAGRVGPSGSAVGLDLQQIREKFPPNVTLLQGDVFASEPATLLAGGRPFDVVLSDMAPPTSGIKAADAARSAELALRALELAGPLLAPGGALLAKVFQGARMAELRAAFAETFSKVTLEKPKASRAESVEIFLLGMGKR